MHILRLRARIASRSRFAVNGDVPMGVDLAHEAVLIPAERWQQWHKIACAIGTTTILPSLKSVHRPIPRWRVGQAEFGLGRYRCPRSRAWTTGDQQRLANAITVELDVPARRRIELAIGRSPQTAGRDIGEKRWKEVRS